MWEEYRYAMNYFRPLALVLPKLKWQHAMLTPREPEERGHLSF